MYGIDNSTSTEDVAKSAKSDTRPVDSGFISSPDISESFSSENFSKSETSDYFMSGQELQEEEMKVDNRMYYLSESLSKIKLEGVCINDLSSDKSEEGTQPWIKEDGSQFLLQDEHGNTHLHLAIYFCYSDMAVNLIRAAISSAYLDLLDQDGHSPIHLAVATNQPQLVRALIVAGAEPNTRNSRGESPLHMAARLGFYSCCTAILEPIGKEEFKSFSLSYNVNHKPVDLEQWNYEGQTCSHIAAVHCHIDILRLFMRCGADINAREGRGGYTILHFAIQNKMEKLAYFLLSECSNLEADVTTYAGKSVLQLGLPINKGLSRTLLLRGAASPYSSEDEDMEDCDSKIIPQNNHLYAHNTLLNGYA